MSGRWGRWGTRGKGAPRAAAWRLLGRPGFKWPVPGRTERAWSGPGSGVGRLLGWRESGQSRWQVRGYLQVNKDGGRGPGPSRKLRPPPPWGPLAAQSGTGGRRRLAHPPNLATFAPLSQHYLVRSPFRRSPLGQGEVEGDDWKQRPGLAPRAQLAAFGGTRSYLFSGTV